MRVATSVSKLHLEKIGFGGSILALACCLGFAPIIALLSALGAAFVVNDAVLAPLLIVFLTLGAVGLAWSLTYHHRPYALILHLAAAGTVYYFTFYRFAQPLIWLGVSGLLAGSALEFIFKRHASHDTDKSIAKEGD